MPIVKPVPPMNATEKELSRAAEEKELVRATTRGWELLSDLEGQCLYFVRSLTLLPSPLFIFVY